MTERDAKEEARKAHADAEARNAELVKKAEDSSRKVDQLQELVQRSVKSMFFCFYFFFGGGGVIAPPFLIVLQFHPAYKIT